MDVELVEIVEEAVLVVEVEGDSSIGASLSLSLSLCRRVDVVEVELNGLTRAMLDVPRRAAAVELTVTLGTPARTGSDDEPEPAPARTGALDDDDDDDDDVLALPALPAVVEGVELLNTE